MVTFFLNFIKKPDHNFFYGLLFAFFSKVYLHFLKMDIYKCPKSKTELTFWKNFLTEKKFKP